MKITYPHLNPLPERRPLCSLSFKERVRVRMGYKTFSEQK
jgi:hypothetical protein